MFYCLLFAYFPENEGGSTGYIVGGAVGGVAAIGLLALILFLLVKKKHNSSRVDIQENGNTSYRKFSTKQTNVSISYPYIKQSPCL